MQYIEQEIKENFAILTLNYATGLNAVTTSILEEIGMSFDRLAQDRNIRCVILTGSDSFFSAGIDVKEREGQDFISLLVDDRRFDLWKKIAGFEKPLIAAVAGYAVGAGMELASLCDIVIAADNARFAVPEITVASLPESGAVKRLIMQLGRAKAMEMLLTGRNMDVHEAEKAGFVSRIVPLGYLLKDAMDVAARIAAQPPLTVSMLKKAARNAYNMDMQEAMETERILYKAAMSTEDAKEGIRAFIEKRPPEFKGK